VLEKNGQQLQWLFLEIISGVLKKEILLYGMITICIGTELDPELSYAKVADACGLKGVTVRTMEETTNAIKQSCEDQKKGITTFIEVILNQELGEPFRRDAMKKPVRVAGINKADMKKQPSLVS
jgi:sulfoacetaldehyde acetyltransferase